MTTTNVVLNGEQVDLLRGLLAEQLDSWEDYFSPLQEVYEQLIESDKFKFEFQHINQYTVLASDEEKADKLFAHLIETGEYLDDVVKSGEILVRTRYSDRRTPETHLWDWKDNEWKATAL